MRNNITIFRGDDTAGPLGRSLTLTLKVPAGVDLAGCSASFEFAGIRRDFPGPLVDGAALAITYTAAETAAMPLGAGFGVLRVWSAEGRVTTVRNTVSVVVTDNVYRAYPGGATNSVEVVISTVAWADIAGRPDLGQMVMPGEPTQRQLAAAVKTLWELLNGKVVYAALAALLSLSSLASFDPSIEWQDIPPTSTVASVVAEFAPGVDTSITNGLRSYTDLSYDIKTVTHYASGTEPWTVVYYNRENVLTNKSPNVWDNRTSSPTEGSGAMRLYYAPSVTSDEYGWWTLEEEEWHEDYGWGPVDGDDKRPAMLPDLVDSIVFDRLGTVTRELSLVTTNVTHDALATTSSVAAVSGTASEALSKAETAGLNAGIAESKANAALESLTQKQATLPYPTNAIPYTALTDTPSIPTVPTQVSAFANDAGYITAETATNIAESAVASADTTYRLTVGVTNLNQSVQYVALDDTTAELAIALPTGDGAKDWLVYVNAATDTTLILPAATWWMSDEAFTNALPAGLTALYFSQISTNGVYSLGRQEMTPITIAP